MTCRFHCGRSADRAYKVLSDPFKLKYYEETGSIEDIDMRYTLHYPPHLSTQRAH